MSEENKKILVIYKSKYGSTHRYAQWIAKEVNADIFEASKFNTNDFKNYEIIIFGGYLHAVGINGIKIINDNLGKLNDKKIIIFAVGCSPEKKEATSNILSSNFSNDTKKRINFFYLRGAFNYDKLNFVDKMMMGALRLKLKRIKEDDLDEDSKGLLKCYDNPVDWTDRNAIYPIIECINNLDC